MISKLEPELMDAVELLRDQNLVWGADFDGIREALANLLLVAATTNEMTAFLANTLAKKILEPGQDVPKFNDIETRG